MKKLVLALGWFCAGQMSAQFQVNIEANDSFAQKEVLVYSYNGSKNFILAQAQKKKGKWVAHIPEYYQGMLRAYFPENGKSIHFIAENKDVGIKLITNGTDILQENYTDTSNQKWVATSRQQQRESALSALKQIQKIYNDNSVFDIALKNEIQDIETNKKSVGEEHQFINYYYDNQAYAHSRMPTQSLVDFLVNSNEMLESSSLLRPILVNYLRTLSQDNIDASLDALLSELNIETPRGQTILAELLSIFEGYGLEAQKQKYYQMASALTCTINQNLEQSINSIKNTEIGAKFEDYTFTPNATNAKVKKLSDVKAKTKVVLFWSSTCPHCLSELPVILENYNKLKSKGVEVVALALDTDRKAYEDRVRPFLWINDTELRGWESNFVEKYNIHATPTYFVLDANNKIISKPANFSQILSTIK